MRTKTTVSDALDAVASRNRPIRIARNAYLAFKDDGGDLRVGYITYYGFLSLLPALLAALTIFDMVFENNKDVRDWLVNSTLSSIPVIGPTIDQNLSLATGHGTTLAITLITLLWAARKGGIAIQDGLGAILETTEKNRGFFTKLIVSYGVIIIIGIGVVVPTIVNAQLDSQVIDQLLLLMFTLIWNVLIVWLLFRVIAPRPAMAGVIVGAVLLTIVQTASVFILVSTLEKSRPLYGTLAVALVLLLWISLQVRAVLFGAEINRAMQKDSLALA